MAPMQGHLMVSKALRIARFVVSQADTLIRTKAPTSTKTATTLNFVRTYTQKPIAIHPIALLKQSKTSSLRANGAKPSLSASKSTASFPGPKYDRSSFPISRTSRAITQKGAAPFASTLRPSLTGGTLSRSAGGYSLGGAGQVKHFSQTSGCQAQVVHSVSAGIRAFLVSGSKARFDGVDPVSGEKRWKAMTKAEDYATQKWEAAVADGIPCSRGTSLEFQLAPTITALLPLKQSAPASSAFDMRTVDETMTLNSPDLLHTLSADFARALHDLALISHDLNKLSAFGDLPISLAHSAQGSLLRVRFPGCDSDAVSALCDEAGIRRGVVVEDPAWIEGRDAEMALLFPFAPAASFEEREVGEFFGGIELRQQHSWRRPSELKRTSTSLVRTSRSSASSLPEQGTEGEVSTLHYDNTPTASLPEDFDESLSEIYFNDDSPLPSSPHSPPATNHRHHADGVTTHQEDYEGVEGIYRFLSAINDARRS